jgi:hypothetical protein
LLLTGLAVEVEHEQAADVAGDDAEPITAPIANQSLELRQSARLCSNGAQAIAGTFSPGRTGITDQPSA